MFRPLLSAAFCSALAAAGVAAPPDAPAPPVAGTVLDAAGAPVAGAEVGTLSRSGPAFTTRTAADGSFTVAREGARAPLVARGPGGGMATSGDGDADGPPVLRLAPPHAMTVTVRGPDGAPAAGVRVLALAPMRPAAEAFTGPDGMAELTLPADAPLLCTVAVRPGVGFGYAARERGGDGRPPADLPARQEIRLAPAFTHRVRCVTTDPATGTAVPAAGAAVSVWYVRLPGQPGDANIGGLDFAKTVADADGVAAFDWLPKTFERSIPLWVGGETYGRVRSYVGRNPMKSPDETADAVAPGEHAVTLERLGAVAGRVTNPDGSPAAGVTVRAEGTYSGADMSENERETAVTDADGRYEMRVRANAAFLVVPLPGSPSMYEEADPPSKLAAAAAGSGAAGSGDPVVVTPGGRRAGLDFALSEGTRLTGAVTRGGEPAAGVTVLLNMIGEFPDRLEHPENKFAHSLDLPRWGKTDAAGRYALRVGPGTYTLSPNYQDRTDPFAVAAGAAEVVRDFDLPAPAEPIEITGTVVDEFGLTLAGVTVAAAEGRWEMRQWPARTASTRSGEDGAFSIVYTRSEYARDRGVYLAATGVDEVRGPLYGYLDLQPTFSSQDPPSTADVTLVARRLAPLTGRAPGPDGAPLAGVRLQLSPADVNDHGASGDPLTLRCVTGPDGRFLFRDAVCGVEQEVFYHPGTTGVYHRVAKVTLDGRGVTDVGAARGLAGDADVPRPDAAERLQTAFAEPDDAAAELAALRSDAALLGRRALVLVADPATDAGRDLFAALYDDAAVAGAADAGFLTRCLVSAPPTRDTGFAPPGRAGVDPAAATLAVLTPDGEPVGTYTHTIGERDAVAAFLKAHAN